MNDTDRLYELFKIFLVQQPHTPSHKLVNEAQIALNNFKRMAEEREKHEESMKALSGAGIEALDLTVRAENCLKSENIYTVDQLCQYSERNLLKINGMGRKALNEVKEALAKMGRTLR